MQNIIAVYLLCGNLDLGFFPKQFSVMWNRCSPHPATATRDEIEVSLTLFCILTKACR